MAHLLNILWILHRSIEKNPNRVFHIMTKLDFLFGYFTQFVNSGISHLCRFAFLPPTLWNTLDLGRPNPQKIPQWLEPSKTELWNAKVINRQIKLRKYWSCYRKTKPGRGKFWEDEVPAGRRTYEKQARRSKRSPSDRKFESG